MNPAEAIIKRLGGTRPTAALLGIPPSTVQSWIAAERIPSKRLPAVVAAAQAKQIELTIADFIPQAAA